MNIILMIRYLTWRNCNMKKKLILILSILILIFLVGILSIYLYIDYSFKHYVPVLAYHAIGDDKSNDMQVSAENFEFQMKYLYEHNYNTLSMDEFYDWKKGNLKLNGKNIVITFDDGIESYYTKALPIMEKYNFKSVNFIINSRIDKKNYFNQEEINELNNNKLVTLGNHSYDMHNHDDAYSKNYNLYDSDLKITEDKKYKYYAYPFGISNEEYKNALKDNGYLLAFKFSPSKWASKDQNDFEVRRVPIYGSTSKLKFILKVLLNIK